MIRIYLAGKIRGLSYNEGVSWRDEATEALRTESGFTIDVLDPMRNKESLSGSAAMPREIIGNIFCRGHNVFSRDVWDVRQSDILLADLRAGTGRFTMFEMGMAYALNIPIILVSDNPERDDSLCLTYAPAAVFDNLDDAISMILSMANSL